MKLLPEEVGRIIAQSRFDVNEEIGSSICMPREMKWFLIKKWSRVLTTDLFGPYSGHHGNRQTAGTVCLARHDQAAVLFEDKKKLLTLFSSQVRDP